MLSPMKRKENLLECPGKCCISLITVVQLLSHIQFFFFFFRMTAFLYKIFTCLKFWPKKVRLESPGPTGLCIFIFYLFFTIIFISWRLITLQYCGGFCHTLTWISHGFTCVPHPELPPTSLPIPSLWVFPVHQPGALVSCIQPGLVICFTLDNIHVSMLFSQSIPSWPSPIESKSLFCTSVSLFLSCI